MNIFQMECFVTLMYTSTFHEASEKLYISQSSFSNNIQAIEKELGVSLIKRGSRSVSLTDAGSAFLCYAERIVSEYKRMTGLLQEYKQKAANRVYIYADPLSSYGYNFILVQFSIHSPEIHAEVTELTDESFPGIIETQKDAVGIVFSKDESSIPGTRSHTLVRDRLAVLVNASHRLADRETIYMRDLCGEKIQIIACSRPLFLNIFLREQCQKAGFEPDIAPYDLWYTSMLETVRKLGLAAVIPERAARLFVQDDTRVIQIVDADPFYINVVISEECTHNAALQFLEFTKSDKNIPI